MANPNLMPSKSQFEELKNILEKELGRDLEYAEVVLIGKQLITLYSGLLSSNNKDYNKEAS